MSIQPSALPSSPCRIPFMSTPNVAPFSSIRLDKSSPNPIYLQIAEGIGELLKSGVLPAGYVLPPERADRKSTRLNSSHITISYAVFCLKKKKIRKEHLQ